VQWDKIKSYVKDLFFDRNSSNFIWWEYNSVEMRETG
jgi:hypothetical protein